jgi:hypothetical protein
MAAWQEQTATAVEGAATQTRRFRVEGSVEREAQTTPQLSLEERTSYSPSSQKSFLTEVGRTGADQSTSWRGVVGVQRQPAPARAVAGTVLSISPPSVQCEFLPNTHEAVRIWLPQSIFPAEARPGFTFELSMTVEGGYRAPKVSPRAPNRDVQMEVELEEMLDHF